MISYFLEALGTAAGVALGIWIFLAVGAAASWLNEKISGRRF